MPELLLFVALAAGIVMLPLGLPGLWVMSGALMVHDWLAPAHAVGWWTIGIVTVLAAVGELIELVLAGRFARRYGGSRRAGWGAIIGSLVGAFVGVPVPVVGSVIGAFAGAFLGALAAELTRTRAVGDATRVATGALLGRVAAVGAKVGIGCAAMAWVAVVLLWHR